MDLVSATQISNFEDCQRKWGWRSIAKIQTPQHPSAALGTEVDDTQLQPYLRDGRQFDFSRKSGYIAAAGLPYLPQPKSNGLEVQRHFVIPSPTWRDGAHIGFGFQGYVDLWMPNGGMPGIDGTYPVVGDFKTTGDLKWQKTDKVLAKDVQAQLYATWAMYETGARTVDLAWIYLQTKKTIKARRTHLRVVADQVAEQFSRINDIALRMYEVRKSVTDPLLLPPNVDMCDAYGGCPYRDKCNLGPGQIIDARAAQAARRRGETMSNTSMGLLAELKAKKAAAAAATAAAPVAPPAPPTLEHHIAENPRAAFLTAPKPVGINPPESTLPPAPPVGQAAEAPKATRGPGRPKKEETAGAAHEPATRPGAAAVAVTATWGKETFQPVPYNTIEIGPFSADGIVGPGETVAQAQARLYGELATFAAAVKEKKIASYVETLVALQGAA